MCALDAYENVSGGRSRHRAAVFEHNGAATASIIVLATWRVRTNQLGLVVLPDHDGEAGSAPLHDGCEGLACPTSAISSAPSWPVQKVDRDAPCGVIFGMMRRIAEPDCLSQGPAAVAQYRGA